MINMAKAQGDIISAVIILIIAMGLVGAAYSWGIPLIQKRQDTAIVNRVLNYFDQNNVNSLPSMIEYAANHGGEQTFSIDADGVWTLTPYDEATPFNNSITFSFFSKVSNFATGLAPDEWISLTSGANCSASRGTVGTHKASTVCARADSVANGYNITYKVLFRELYESSGAKGYKINLVKHESSPKTSTGRSMRISLQDVKYSEQSNLIETTIKILLG
jgi:hypothetical protein